MRIQLSITHSAKREAICDNSAFVSVHGPYITISLINAVCSSSQSADYMANFSPINRAKISARRPEQIFLKRRCKLKASQLRLKIPARFVKTGLHAISTRANGLKSLM